MSASHADFSAEWLFVSGPTVRFFFSLVKQLPESSYHITGWHFKKSAQRGYSIS
jgi:hypothetical protein